jgi:hypothetical protein
MVFSLGLGFLDFVGSLGWAAAAEALGLLATDFGGFEFLGDVFAVLDGG